jgi:hypothetical protein
MLVNSYPSPGSRPSIPVAGSGHGEGFEEAGESGLAALELAPLPVVEGEPEGGMRLERP